jgi:2-dehydro-3-deoxygalactonokinase
VIGSNTFNLSEPLMRRVASGETRLNGIDWIAVDWGTSNLRVWGRSATGQVLAEASSDRGMAKLDRTGFEPALLDLIDNWLPPNRKTPVIACGMAGARQGWIEVPYRQAPCKPDVRDSFGCPDTRDPRLMVRVLAGIKQTKPAPDVMRGEETQIAGILLENPGFAGVLCLPGTHTKWVEISDGVIARFQTFMTGELFNLLTTQSVLRHNVEGAGWDRSEFADSVKLMMSEPQNFAARLFSIRADALISGLDHAVANARLSGTLLGAELAATQRYWQGQQVTIVGNGTQSEMYAEGLRALDQTPRIVDASSVTLSGLQSAYDQIVRDFK